MIEYITFHPVTFKKDNLGIKHLFGLDTQIQLGIQQFSGTFLRNPKNSNQIRLPEEISISSTEYNKFTNSDEAFDIIKSYIYNEYKITDDELDTILEKNKRDLYFYFFEEEEDKDKPRFRGILHSSCTSTKPLFYVAFSKSIEFEYDRDLYRK